MTKEKREALEMRERVEKALESIRPGLQADGGDLKLVDIEENVVKLQLKGACASCPLAAVTLKHGVEMSLKEIVPEVDRVEAV